MTLEFSGERFIPGSGIDITNEHVTRYSAIAEFVKNKVVVDVPSGEGYGSFVLSEFALSVTGVDISHDAVKHAKSTYARSNLSFIQGSMEKLTTIESHTVDVVVCFEGIEHVDEATQVAALNEFKRILKKSGTLIISTPNKAKYSDAVNYQNPYHVKEFYVDEFAEFLSPSFKFIRFFGQNLHEGVSILPFLSDSSAENRSDDISLFVKEGDHYIKSKGFGVNKFTQTYVIAFCSHEAPPSNNLLGAVFVDDSRALIEHLKACLEEYQNRNSELEFLNKLKDTQIKALKQNAE